MATYGAQIKFITDTKQEALVYQTDVLSVASAQYDGWRFVRADFSLRAVNDIIVYTYNTGDTALANDITIA